MFTFQTSKTAAPKAGAVRHMQAQAGRQARSFKETHTHTRARAPQMRRRRVCAGGPREAIHDIRGFSRKFSVMTERTCTICAILCGKLPRDADANRVVGHNLHTLRGAQKHTHINNYPRMRRACVCATFSICDAYRICTVNHFRVSLLFPGFAVTMQFRSGTAIPCGRPPVQLVIDLKNRPFLLLLLHTHCNKTPHCLLAQTHSAQL